MVVPFSFLKSIRTNKKKQILGSVGSVCLCTELLCENKRHLWRPRQLENETGVLSTAAVPVG